MIVGLVGKKRTGKDTVADYLVKNFNFTKYSLADSMKRAVRDIFLMSDEQLWGEDKEEIDTRYNTTPRKILQIFGTELFQNDIYKHIPELSIPPKKIWIYRFIQWYKNNCEQNVVISDVRFQHEVEEIKKMDGTIIKIFRNLPNNDNHVSEMGVEEIKQDYSVFNDGTINDLYKKINKLISDKLWDIYLGL